MIRRILSFPLWVVLLAALLVEKPKRMDGFERAQYRLALRSLELAINVPVSGWRLVAYNRLAQWITGQMHAIDMLMMMGVTVTEES